MKRIIAALSVWIGIFIFVAPVFAYAKVQPLGARGAYIGSITKIEAIILMVSIFVIILSFAALAYFYRRMK